MGQHGGEGPAVGTYLFFFALAREVCNCLGEFSGDYCYVGSAFGPGGLRARLARHLRRGKPIQWHIDLLSTSEHFVPTKAFVTGNRIECELAEMLSQLAVPHRGFGASDCTCQSHLFRIQSDSMARVLEAVESSGLVELELDKLR